MATQAQRNTFADSIKSECWGINQDGISVGDVGNYVIVGFAETWWLCSKSVHQRTVDSICESIRDGQWDECVQDDDLGLDASLSDMLADVPALYTSDSDAEATNGGLIDLYLALAGRNESDEQIREVFEAIGADLDETVNDLDARHVK